MNAKILALGLLSLFLVGVASPLTIGIEIEQQNRGHTLITSGSGEEKPDLVITDIFEKNDFNYPFSYDCLYVKVLNDGDVSVGGFKIRTIIERLLFNSIVIRTVYDHTTWYGSSNPLSPGEEWNCTIFQDKFFFPGFYNIHTIVNPDKDIDEYDYSNNERYERFFGRGIIFWRWYQSY